VELCVSLQVSSVFSGLLAIAEECIQNAATRVAPAHRPMQISLFSERMSKQAPIARITPVLMLSVGSVLSVRCTSCCCCCKRDLILSICNWSACACVVFHEIVSVKNGRRISSSTTYSPLLDRHATNPVNPPSSMCGFEQNHVDCSLPGHGAPMYH
jgi:hypothetical protein